MVEVAETIDCVAGENLVYEVRKLSATVKVAVFGVDVLFVYWVPNGAVDSAPLKQVMVFAS